MQEDAKAVVFSAEAEGILRLYALGALTPEDVDAECKRILEHPQGCPEAVRQDLEAIKALVRQKGTAS